MPPFATNMVLVWPSEPLTVAQYIHALSQVINYAIYLMKYFENIFKNKSLFFKSPENIKFNLFAYSLKALNTWNVLAQVGLVQ